MSNKRKVEDENFLDEYEELLKKWKGTYRLDVINRIIPEVAESKDNLVGRIDLTNPYVPYENDKALSSIGLKNLKKEYPAVMHVVIVLDFDVVIHNIMTLVSDDYDDAFPYGKFPKILKYPTHNHNTSWLQDYNVRYWDKASKKYVHDFHKVISDAMNAYYKTKRTLLIDVIGFEKKYGNVTNYGPGCSSDEGTCRNYFNLMRADTGNQISCAISGVAGSVVNKGKTLDPRCDENAYVRLCQGCADCATLNKDNYTKATAYDLSVTCGNPDVGVVKQGKDLGGRVLNDAETAEKAVIDDSKLLIGGAVDTGKILIIGGVGVLAIASYTLLSNPASISAVGNSVQNLIKK